MKFDWEKLRREHFSNIKLTVPGLILALLNIGPIRGKTMLQKEVFLAWKEVFGGKYVMDPIFHPYHYGPYSQMVSDSQTILRSRQEIRVLSKGEMHQTYVISQKGKLTLAEEIRHSEIPEDILNMLSTKKMDWDEWTSKGMMRYIYRKYPEYAVMAKIKELKW